MSTLEMPRTQLDRAMQKPSPAFSRCIALGGIQRSLSFRLSSKSLQMEMKRNNIELAETDFAVTWMQPILLSDQNHNVKNAD